ncbi:hypothetical protein R8510_04935 [Ralstonia chuxiongensis]|nr:hypothetical protein R8510_04935 [Ralstonia chuxiongensis]
MNNYSATLQTKAGATAGQKTVLVQDKKMKAPRLADRIIAAGERAYRPGDKPTFPELNPQLEEGSIAARMVSVGERAMGINQWSKA